MHAESEGRQRPVSETASPVGNERRVFLLVLSAAIRPLRNPEAIKAAALRVLAQQRRANRVFYADVNGDDWIVERGWAPAPTGRTLRGSDPWPLDHGPGGHLLLLFTENRMRTDSSDTSFIRLVNLILL